MDIFVKNVEQFDSVEKPRNSVIHFNCMACNKPSTFKFRVERLENQRRLLCSMCAMKNTNLKKYGTEYSSQAESIKDKISAKSSSGIQDEVFVNSSEEFDKIPKKTSMVIKYNCVSCNKPSSVLF